MTVGAVPRFDFCRKRGHTWRIALSGLVLTSGDLLSAGVELQMRFKRFRQQGGDLVAAGDILYEDVAAGSATIVVHAAATQLIVATDIWYQLDVELGALSPVERYPLAEGKIRVTPWGSE